MRSGIVTRPIIETVASDHGVTADAILSRSKVRRVAAARRDAICRVYQTTGWSLSRIARSFDRDRKTIFHALRAVRP